MDRRKRKSKKAIFTAFIKLLEQKDYYQITVQEIIDEADIGRATFYAYFETKDYLLKSLCEELFEHVINSATDDENSSHLYLDCNMKASSFLHLLQHIQHNDDNILTLLSCTNNEIFLQYFKNELRDMIQEQFLHKQAVNKTDLPENYIINHVSVTFIETINWWLNHKLQDSPEKMIEYFFTILEGVVEFKSVNERSL